MRANSPSAFFTSLTLHSVVAGLIIFFTYYSVWQQGPPPVIFELVAGPPTAPDELVAPALGNSLTPVKLDVPKVELPAEKPEPKVEEVVPTVTTVETPPASDVVPPPPKPKAKPKSDNPLLAAMKKNQQRAKVKWNRDHPTPKPVASTNPRTGNVPRIDVEGIAQGVKGGSTANKRGGGGGKALTREEHNALDTYISMLRAALLEAHAPPPGVNEKLVAQVTFDITAGGHILNPRISKSSGDKDFDESVLDAFRRVRNIGPTPNGKSDTWTVAFKMSEE